MDHFERHPVGANIEMDQRAGRLCTVVAIVRHGNFPHAVGFKAVSYTHLDVYKRQIRLIIRQQLRHAARMFVKDVTVSPEDQFATVLMALPFRDDFDIDTLLDGAGNEHPPKRALAVRCETEPFTRSCKGFLGVFDL